MIFSSLALALASWWALVPAAWASAVLIELGGFAASCRAGRLCGLCPLCPVPPGETEVHGSPTSFAGTRS
jgi:hypothetical protein